MINQMISLKYMLTGYGVILFVLLVYLVNLIIRWRKLKRELSLLEDTRHQ
jgi:CcmD family protein